MRTLCRCSLNIGLYTFLCIFVLRPLSFRTSFSVYTLADRDQGKLGKPGTALRDIYVSKNQVSRRFSQIGYHYNN